MSHLSNCIVCHILSISLPSFNIFSLSLFTFVKQLIYFENNNNTFKCSVPFFTSSTRTGFNTIWGVRKLSLNSTSKSARACSSSSASRGRSSYIGGGSAASYLGSRSPSLVQGHVLMCCVLKIKKKV